MAAEEYNAFFYTLVSTVSISKVASYRPSLSYSQAFMVDKVRENSPALALLESGDDAGSLL